MHPNFLKSNESANEIVLLIKKVRKGSTISEAGINAFLMLTYTTITEWEDRDRRYGISGYPYEFGPAVSALVGGFLEHKDWKPW